MANNSLTPSGPAPAIPRRYPLTRAAYGAWRYGPWIIELLDWQRPDPRFDFDWHHEDYDGPEDGRAGSAESFEECIAQINEYEEQA